MVCAVTALMLGLTACGGGSPAAPVVTMPSGTTSAAAIPSIDPLRCDPSTAAPGETVTNGQGGRESALSVVADYHWAIITGRDTARATDDIATGAPMASPSLISQALEGYPPGTTYCLRMRQTRPDTVLFTLTYQPPAGGTSEYRLRATVTGAPGDVRITGAEEQ
ncbi:hypothetical protein ASG12_01895 [Williamsia sp. Leaf354]|uniref:hypothetical protein n=1 Tax=Williamsia sp. Leaf354 TaxID=1736349 RepID=UPI0006F742D2|nr:hypothetical protein [Williamsia sp. Leaf354]KQR99584.1 hypothetical protein ASG12_01895 [Williamsia sp. Leaf354]